MRTQLVSFAAALALGAAACGGQPETQADDPDQVIPEAAPVPAASLPDTTEAALWAYLRQSDYQHNWRLFPGKDQLYPGTEPHGMLLTTYVNDLAFDALTNGARTLPAGAIIVKENYMPDSTLAAITTMYRVEGYNPQHQDWFFAKHDPQGMAEVSGRAEMCQACHRAAPEGDYLYTARPR
jgi:hypothetical protein